MSRYKNFDLNEDQTQIICDGACWKVEDVIAGLEPYMLESRVQRMKSILDQRLGSVVLGLEDLHLEHNGAACLRTAEGLGIQHIAAAEITGAFPLGEEPENVLGVPRKVTMAAHCWLSLHKWPNTDGIFDFAKEQGLAVYGAGPRSDFMLDEIPLDKPVMLLFGNEKKGLRENTMKRCDGVFRIPMYGFTESYNVSVSVGMAMHVVCERRRAQLREAGLTGDLPGSQKAALMAQWMLKDQEKPAAMLRRLLTPVGKAH